MNFKTVKTNYLQKKIFGYFDKKYQTALSWGFKLKKMNTIPTPELTPAQRKQIKDYWSPYFIRNDYFSFYNTLNPSSAGFDVRYMPGDLYYCYVDAWYNNSNTAKTLNDKNYYNMLFADVNQPKTIARRINNIFLDKDYKPIAFDNIVDAVIAAKGVILKVSAHSSGGHGCFFWKEGESRDNLIHLLKSQKNYILQELIQQHEQMNRLHAESINTIRIISFLRNGELKILSSIVRMGVGNSCVDNISSGGIFCGIDENGRLKKYAYTYLAKDRFEQHPTTGVTFEGFPIPGIDKCKKVVNDLAWRISKDNQLLSWDFAIDKDGNPIFIEVNMSDGGLGIHQMTNGPIFGDDVKAIVDEVFNSRGKRLLQKLFFYRCKIRMKK